MKTITDINQIDPNDTYTYADYLTWRFKERVELLWGKICKMTPAPSTGHQQVSSVIHGYLFQFLKGPAFHARHVEIRFGPGLQIEKLSPGPGPDGQGKTPDNRSGDNR